MSARADASPEPRGARAASHIDIRALETTADMHAASRVLSDVWDGDRTGMPANLLRALAHAGSYVVGLYDADRMIGASAAFFAEPDARSLHSHITGILPEYRGQGIGHAAKLHQRDWASARGIRTITWTFDPLVARNAHFNLRVLGARVTEYLVDFYGAMDDGVNRGDESDRLLVTWDVAAPPSAAAAPPAASPSPAAAAPPDRVVAAVAVPHDIEALRRAGSTDAAAWRRRVRAAFARHQAAGLVVAGFDDERGYLFVRPSRAR